MKALWWRHNDHDSVSNHQPHECLLNRLFRRRSKKTSKLRVTGLCVGNSPGPVNSPHKGPVTRKMFPFDDVIMVCVSNLSHPFLWLWKPQELRIIDFLCGWTWRAHVKLYLNDFHNGCVFRNIKRMGIFSKEKKGPRVHHRCGNIILMKFSPLAAPEVVQTTTSGAAQDENVKMTTFPFRWCIMRRVT